MCIIVAAVTLLAAAALLWFGIRSADQVDRLVREGRLAQGTELTRTSEGRNESVSVAYVVDGRRYVLGSSSPERRSPSSLDPAPVPLPRLGPERPLQVVYLPGDPGVARLRGDLKPGMAAYLFAAGLFGFIGLVFGAMAFVLRPRRGRFR